jgi:hypothetical protein
MDEKWSHNSNLEYNSEEVVNDDENKDFKYAEDDEGKRDEEVEGIEEEEEDEDVCEEEKEGDGVEKEGSDEDEEEEEEKKKSTVVFKGGDLKKKTTMKLAESSMSDEDTMFESICVGDLKKKLADTAVNHFKPNTVDAHITGPFHHAGKSHWVVVYGRTTNRTC